jgi:hypothetical protein
MARKDKMLSGTVEERLVQADNILRRLVRRSKGSMAITYIPPIPIMSGHYNSEDGIIIRAVIPAVGTITTIAMFVDLAEGIKNTDFIAELTSTRVTTGVTFNIKHTLTRDDLNIPVIPGDVLTVRAINPSDIIDAAASALYKISPNAGDINKQLIDEIDKLEEI